MAQVIQFFVDDTSPAFSYSPFRDTLSVPNLTAGWNPYFDDSGFPTASVQVGVGKSYHATSLNNASLSLQWKGNHHKFRDIDPSDFRYRNWSQIVRIHEPFWL